MQLLLDDCISLPLEVFLSISCLLTIVFSVFSEINFLVGDIEVPSTVLFEALYFSMSGREIISEMIFDPMQPIFATTCKSLLFTFIFDLF